MIVIVSGFEGKSSSSLTAWYILRYITSPAQQQSGKQREVFISVSMQSSDRRDMPLANDKHERNHDQHRPRSSCCV
jgi:hypothetical protein